MSNITIRTIPATVQKDQGIRLTMEGQLTIQNTEAVKRQLLEILPVCEHISIVLQNVTDLDLAFMQLLLATLQTSRTLQKKVILEAQLPEELQLILKKNGFTPLLVRANQS